MSDFDWTNVTEEAIDTANTSYLRWLAFEAELPDYSTQVYVASVELTNELANCDGALTKLDQLLAVLKRAYVGREPQIMRRYGTTVEMRVWAEDSALRAALRHVRESALKKLAEDDSAEG